MFGDSLVKVGCSGAWGTVWKTWTVVVFWGQSGKGVVFEDSLVKVDCSGVLGQYDMVCCSGVLGQYGKGVL